MLRTLTIGLALAAALVLFSAPRAAHASCSATKQVEVNGKMKKEPRIGKPEKTFGGTVLVSTKQFPTWATSVSSYISKVKKNGQKKFQEDKDKKEWKIEFIAFFKKPLDDMEVSIRLYDVGRGQKRMVTSFDQFLDRCATSYASSMTLKRENFGVNKSIVVTVESRRAGVIATGKFEILGKADKFTGKADFSDEIVEVKKPEEDDEDEDAAAKKKADAERTAALDDPDPVEEPLDVNDPSLYKSDLDPTEGFAGKPPEQRKSRGCGCGVTSTGDAAGGLLLLGAVLVLSRRRRRL